MVSVRDDWFKYLSDDLLGRGPRFAKLQQWADGDAPASAGVLRAGAKFQDFWERSHRNFADLIVSAVSDRIRIAGFRTGADADENGDLEARRIMRENNLLVRFADLHRWFLTFGEGYSIVGRGADGRAVITTHSPRELVTYGADPLNPDAALRTWTDPRARVAKAALWLPGELNVATRRFENGAATGEWSWSDPQPTGVDGVPVTGYVNRGGVGEFEKHIPLLASIEHMVLQRLIIATTQAFKQRAVKGDLPSHDEEGNEIDYNGLFESGPDALWTLPEGVDIWESGQTDLSGILNGTKSDIEHLAAVTQTPMFYLMPEGANQSATGAQVAREGASAKAKDRIDRLSSGHSRTMSLAFQVNGDQQRADLLDLEPMWAPVDQYSLSEKADAASKATDIPFRYKMTEIWQFPPQLVDEMETERTGEALLAAVTNPAPAVAVTGGQPNPPVQ